MLTVSKAQGGTRMDDELKQYLDAIEARILLAGVQMESRLIAALNTRERQLDPIARKLEGVNDAEDSDSARIEAGH